jgi:hypothetical protein
MKTQLLKFTALLLILTGLATSCNPECPDCPDPEVYPKEISFTEYSLEGTSCQWKNLPYNDKVMIINSSEELEKYISCNGGSYPAIDFSKHSLLLASGKTDRDIDEITATKLKQFSPNTYKLKVEIALKFTTIYGQFYQYGMALLVEKINEESIVELNVTLKEPEIILPIEIKDMDTETYLFFIKTLSDYIESSYFFEGIPMDKDTCFMINTMQEFRQACVYPDSVPEIDFEKYTLIIGKYLVHYNGCGVVSQKIFEDSALTLLVRVINGFLVPMEAIVYHWGLYPKLPEKPFYVKYNM